MNTDNRNSFNLSLIGVTYLYKGITLPVKRWGHGYRIRTPPLSMELKD